MLAFIVKSKLTLFLTGDDKSINHHGDKSKFSFLVCGDKTKFINFKSKN